jgi:hypothetical protein
LRIAPLVYGTIGGSLIIYLAIVTINRFAFLVQDSAGIYCTSHAIDPTVPAPLILSIGETKEVEFSIATFCFYSGVEMRPGERYYIKVEPTGPWYDAGIPINPSGMMLTDYPPWLRPFKVFAEPFKRSVGIPWFTMIMRVGRRGGDENYVLSDTDPRAPYSEVVIRPRIQGTLYLYINDAVLGIPVFEDAFYRNNSGRVKVTIRRTR